MLEVDLVSQHKLEGGKLGVHPIEKKSPSPILIYGQGARFHRLESPFISASGKDEISCTLYAP